MDPTKGQQEALDAIYNLAGDLWPVGSVAVISGAAGTGKTSLLRFLREKADGQDIFVLTPTGKAAQRVKEASGLDAMTAHRWMYYPSEDERTGEVSFRRVGPEDVRYPANGVLLVDEASMIAQDMWNDLKFMAQTCHLKIALIGDGYQLPPVEKDFSKAAFSVFSPDFPADIRVNLTEVLRQALESPIIRTVTGIRLGEDIDMALAPWDTGLRLEDVMMKTIYESGAVIAYTNRTRQDLNHRARAIMGLAKNQLMPSEPLLVMRNNYDVDVFNGEVHRVTTVTDFGVQPCTDRFQHITKNVSFSRVTSGVADDALGIKPRDFLVANEEVFDDLPPKFYWGGIFGGSRRACDEKDLYPRIPYIQANMGYVLTCHKSQGSEWDSVLVVIEQSLKLNTPNGRRWAYTALTRAKKTLRLSYA
jgi:exodeoxyribonuclease V